MSPKCNLLTKAFWNIIQTALDLPHIRPLRPVAPWLGIITDVRVRQYLVFSAVWVTALLFTPLWRGMPAA
jgi:hypothetical protein